MNLALFIVSILLIIVSISYSSMKYYLNNRLEHIKHLERCIEQNRDYFQRTYKDLLDISKTHDIPKIIKEREYSRWQKQYFTTFTWNKRNKFPYEGNDTIFRGKLYIYRQGLNERERQRIYNNDISSITYEEIKNICLNLPGKEPFLIDMADCEVKVPIEKIEELETKIHYIKVITNPNDVIKQAMDATKPLAFETDILRMAAQNEIEELCNQVSIIGGNGAKIAAAGGQGNNTIASKAEINNKNL